MDRSRQEYYDGTGEKFPAGTAQFASQRVMTGITKEFVFSFFGFFGFDATIA